MRGSIRFLPHLAFALFAGLLAVSLLKHYSDVPFWDMWDGYLEFYNRLLKGDITAWWYQHNEHRIILSRLLFWMDLSWFGGKSAFLIIINFMLATSSALLMGAIFRDMFRGESYKISHWLLYTLCLTMPLSWMQQDSLAWAFQSQFFLAQLLPLVAFYCFYLSEQKPSWGWFWTSMAVGIASAGTMANGVAVIPILTLVALLVSDARIKKSLFYGIASIVVLTLYFSDYQSPSGHGSLIQTFIEQPWGMLKYTALYIGSPIHFLLNMVMPEAWNTAIFYVAMVSGFCLMISSLWVLITCLKQPRSHLLEIALLGFIAYIGATAFGTAGGRLMFGLEQAMEGRYRTPAILLWLCFLILIHKASNIRTYARYITDIKNLGFSVLLLLLLIPQFHGVKTDNISIEFERNMAVLAMTLGIKDTEQIGHVYPWFDSVMVYSQNSIANEISIFSESGRFYKLSQKAVTPVSSVESQRCQGSLDTMVPVIGDSKYLRMRGWLFEDDTQANKPYPIFSSEGEHIGYLLFGEPRPDVAQTISQEAMHSGFGGYFERSPGIEPRITVQFEDKTCWLDLPFSDLPFQISQGDWEKVNITVDNIINNENWYGSDFDKTQKSGYVILGSYVVSDKDMGELTLIIEKEDTLMFRTGPSSKGQFLKVSTSSNSYPLPNSMNWSLLNFTNYGAEESVKVKLIDRGEGWGQWSAVGLNVQK